MGKFQNLNIYKLRVKKLQSFMRESKINLIILTSQGESWNNNIIYYTGFRGAGTLFVKQKSMTLYVSKLECEKASKTGVKTIVIDKEKNKYQIKQITGNSKIIGIDAFTMSVHEFQKYKKITKGRYKDISTSLFKIRSIKDNVEIRAISKACTIGDFVFLEVIKKFNSKEPFITEIELKTFIENSFRNRGLDISFFAIASSGKNASIIHHNSDSSKIKKGFLIMDFGCKVDGYCSDMTRTIYIGRPSQKEIEKYEKLLSAQEESINFLRIAKTTGDVDKFCREKLGKDESLFSHGLGHGVGLNIHELPNLRQESKDKILPGQILTIEPGMYLKEEFGMRIEDTILITKKGPKILTKSKKELIVVGK